MCYNILQHMRRLHTDEWRNKTLITFPAFRSEELSVWKTVADAVLKKMLGGIMIRIA